MITKLDKISSATAVLLKSSTDTVDATTISIANIDGSNAASVDLYFTDSDSVSYYIFKNLDIPSGASLTVNGMDLDINKEIYSLYIKTNGTVDVITRY